MSCRFLPVFLLLLASCQQDNESGQSNDDTLQTFQKDTTSQDTFHEMITTYEDPERSEWQNPSLVIDKLGNLKGKTVADIGSGTGYFSFRLASQGAHVLAIDIDSQFLRYIDQRQEGLIPANEIEPVETRLSKPDDPLLADNEADAVLMVNTYTYIDHRVDYLSKVYQGMASDGTIVIVDYKGVSNPVVGDSIPVMNPESVALELEQAGFVDVVIDKESLQYQYIITARKS